MLTLPYVAGFLDAKGKFSFKKINNKLIPQFTLYMPENQRPILESIQRWASENGISLYIYDVKPHSKFGGKSKRLRFCNNSLHTLRLGKLLEPYLVKERESVERIISAK